jgi:hypothetical protein
MNKTDVIKIARKVADKDKVDPVNSQGDMITLSPEELMRLIGQGRWRRWERARSC